MIRHGGRFNRRVIRPLIESDGGVFLCVRFDFIFATTAVNSVVPFLERLALFAGALTSRIAAARRQRERGALRQDHFAILEKVFGDDLRQIFA